MEISQCPDGIKDLSGSTHEFYEVLGFHHRNGKRRYWVCRCMCGTINIVREDSLHRRCRKCHTAGVSTHGMSKTPEFAAWSQMISRCTDSKRADWDDYGGRGVAVCDRWRDSFANFYADMGPRPSRNHSLDRYPNNEGNYAPENCRWATVSQQARNRRSNRMVEYEGQTLALAEICDKHAVVSYSIVLKRLGYGWTLQDALTKPYGFRPQKHQSDSSLC